MIKLGESENHFVPGFDPEREPHEIWPHTPLAVPKSMLARLENARPEEVAAAAQRVLEDIVSRHVAEMCRRTGQSRVALSGGVFANVKLNQRILDLEEVSQIYVHPNMGDRRSGRRGRATGLCAGSQAGGGIRPLSPGTRLPGYRVRPGRNPVRSSRDRASHSPNWTKWSRS